MDFDVLQVNQPMGLSTNSLSCITNFICPPELKLNCPCPPPPPPSHNSCTAHVSGGCPMPPGPGQPHRMG